MGKGMAISLAFSLFSFIHWKEPCSVQKFPLIRIPAITALKLLIVSDILRSLFLFFSNSQASFLLLVVVFISSPSFLQYSIPIRLLRALYLQIENFAPILSLYGFLCSEKDRGKQMELSLFL